MLPRCFFQVPGFQCLHALVHEVVVSFVGGVGNAFGVGFGAYALAALWAVGAVLGTAAVYIYLVTNAGSGELFKR